MRLRHFWMLLIAASFFVTGLVAPQQAHAAPIDTSSRQAVQEAYQQRLKPALAVPIGWTGNAANCVAGAPSAAAQQATLDAVNYFREMGGLDPVTFNATFSRKAQAAALVFAANNNLSHDIPDSWRCVTADAKEGARSSNLVRTAGADAVLIYMDDPGSSNTAVGHRRWLMRPSTAVMGSGSTSNTNALWILDSTVAGRANPTWVPWPTAGYFPHQVEPDGRWSLSGNTTKVDFRSATVTVTGPDGPLAVTKQAQSPDPTTNYYMGNATLVFEVGDIPQPKVGEVHDYTVRVTGIRNAATTSHSYTVRMIHADPVTITAGPTTPPSAPSKKYERTAPYTLAGNHVVNGRQWRTSCEPYSRTERCRSEIWATVVVKEGNSFVRKDGWAFNNLTYLPYMTEADWQGNPLGMHNMGGFESGGRMWRTECHTPQTGRGACRSYTMTTVYAATPRAGGGYVFSQSNDWVFNNLVLFGAPSWR